MFVFILFAIGAFIVISLFMPWVQRGQINELQRELEHLQNMIRRGQFQAPQSSVPKHEVADHVTETYEPVPEAASIRLIQPQIVEPITQNTINIAHQYAQDEIEDDTQDDGQPVASGSRFEFNIGTKLPVWIGAISLIFSAFYLVKYSIDSGWLGPVTRLTMGGLFGTALVVGGHWLSKKIDISNYKRISQGLLGAGLVSLYVSIYAAVNLYELIPPITGFCGMVSVTALAIVLSLKHGQPIAIFGLIGGFLTPAVIGSNEPNAASLFLYLFALSTSMMYILILMGWWILATLALLGVYVWTGFWFMTSFGADDAWVLASFALASYAVVMALTYKFTLRDDVSPDISKPAHNLNFIAIGGAIITLIWLSFKVTLSLFDWSMLGLLSLGCFVLTCVRPHVYQKTFAALFFVNAAMLYGWSHDALMDAMILVTLGMSALYVLLPYLAMRRLDDPRLIAGTHAAAFIFLLLFSYFEILEGLAEPIRFMPGMMAATFALMSVERVRHSMVTYQGTIQKHTAAIYAFAGSALVSVGMALELPYSYLPLAYAAQTAATVWIARKYSIPSLKVIAYLLTAIFIGTQYQLLSDFAELILESIAGKNKKLHGLNNMDMQFMTVKFIIPAFFFGAAFVIRGPRTQDVDRTSHMLFGTSLALIMAASYCAIRLWYNVATVGITDAPLFIERGIITMMIAAFSAAILQISRDSRLLYLRVWGMALAFLVMSRVAWFDLVMFNPLYHNKQVVGSLFLANGITLTFGGSFLLALFASREPYGSMLYKLAALALLLITVSLNVRHFFHGEMLVSSVMSNTELYTYSAVWLLTGLGILAFGIMKDSKAARMASLAVILLTIGKVFLIDAAALTGLYRVFSFLGLGVSLIGISYFYSKFVFKDKERV